MSSRPQWRDHFHSRQTDGLNIRLFSSLVFWLKKCYNCIVKKPVIARRSSHDDEAIPYFNTITYVLKTGIATRQVFFQRLATRNDTITKNSMLLQNFLPNLSTDISTIIIHTIAIIGIILLIYAVFLETEKRQDVIFIISGLCLFIYALFINNLIFIIATAGLTLASLVEFIEILLGIHRDTKYNLKQLIRKK